VKLDRKELIARAIHDRSRRKDRTFVKPELRRDSNRLVESEVIWSTKREPLRAPLSKRLGDWNCPTKARCFWMKWETSHLRFSKVLRALQEREFERLGSTYTRKVMSLGSGNESRSGKDGCD